MPTRDLPDRPNLDHLKNEAKALRKAFRAGDAAALERVLAVLEPGGELRLAHAQRVIAREYGFASWSKLRSHVQAARGVEDATAAFLAAVAGNDVRRARAVLSAEPHIAETSVHVAAVLGRADVMRRLIAENAARVSEPAGSMQAGPLLWLCYSPFHGESPERDDDLADTLRILLERGGDPGEVDIRYGVPALYAVTGLRDVPRLARMLLEAGASPTDGESVFHAAANFHEAALALLLEFGVQLNVRGDWGNTPLYFLLRYHDVRPGTPVSRGVAWLLEHGADPNVTCGREAENALHVAVRRRQPLDVVQRLLAHGADVHLRRGDGRSPWVLARRAGDDALVEVLEKAGAVPEPLEDADLLCEACSRGDAGRAARLANADLLERLGDEGLRMLPEAAESGRGDTVRACLAAGFPVNITDGNGATALHHAALRGRAAMMLDLLHHGADLTLRDPEHAATPLGWALFGADHIREPGGDYEGCVRALLRAGATPPDRAHEPEHAGVREVLRSVVEERPGLD